MIRELTDEIMPFSYEEMDRTRSMIGSYSWSIEGQTMMSSLTAFNFFYQTKQTDSMLPRVCLPIDRSQKTSKYGGNNSDALICTSGADIFVIQNIHKVLRFSTCILHWWNIALHHFFIRMARLTRTKYFCLRHMTSVRISSPLPWEHLTININSLRKQGNTTNEHFNHVLTCSIIERISVKLIRDVFYASTENGSYIYIQTLSPRKYDERARLKSLWMRGPLRMTFFYSMYGSTIETLSVYVIINGRESRIWSRHGNRSSRDWIKGCVAISYEGTYQVVQLRFSLRKH